MEKKVALGSQLKLTLTRDPRIPTPTKHSGSNVPSSVAVVDLVGVAPTSKSTALTQTCLFAGKPKVIPGSAVPRVKPDAAMLIKMGSGSVISQPKQQSTSDKGHQPQSPHIKPVPAPQKKPSPSANVKQVLSAKPSLSDTKTQPAQSAHAKLSANLKPLSAKPSLSGIAKAPPSKAVHTILPSSQFKLLSPQVKLSSSHSLLQSSLSNTLSPLSNTLSPLSNTLSPLSNTRPNPPPANTKAPPPSLIKSSSSRPANPSLSKHASSLPSPRAKMPPPLIKEASKGKSAPGTKVAATGIKTIIVELPPSLVSGSALPNSTLPQTATAKFPPSLITSSVLPIDANNSSLSLLTTSSTPPLEAKRPATTSVAPSASDDLSPSKAKKAKVMKPAILPISRIKTIMKTNVQSLQQSLQLSQESVLVITKATELFISRLSQGAQQATPANRRVVGYNPLASSVQTSSKFQFLRDIVPKKVIAKEYLEQQGK